MSCPYGNHSTWKKLNYKNWHSAEYWKNAIGVASVPLFLKQSELDGEVPLSLTHSPLSFLFSSLNRIHLTGCDHRLMKHAECHFLALLYPQNMHFSAAVRAIVTDTWNEAAFRMLSECSRLFTSCTFCTHGLAEPHFRDRCNSWKRIFHFQWLLLFNASLKPCQGYRHKYVYTIEWVQDYCNISDTGSSSGKLQPGGGLKQAFTSSMVLAQERVYCQRWDTIKNS